MSATRFSLTTNAFMSKNNPASPVSFAKWTGNGDTSFPYPRYSPPSELASAPSSHKRKSSTIRKEVPRRGKASAMECDVRKEAAALMKRVETAEKRLLEKNGVVAQLQQALRDDNANHAHAVEAALKAKQASTKASADLKLARAQARAAKRKSESDSRPRRVLRIILASWGAQARSGVEEAARIVDEARRAHSLAKARRDAACEVRDRSFDAAQTTAYFLRQAEDARVRATEIYHALEAKAARAKHRAVYAATAVEVGRCWANDAHARGSRDSMEPLLIAASLASSIEDDFTDDQVVSKAKRPRH